MRHDTIRRAVRTYLQVLVPSVAAAWPANITGAGQLLDLVAAAAWSAVPALFAFLQGELEDAGRIKDRRNPPEVTP